MAKSWQDLQAELEAETKRIFTTCPDEIKKFHYGIMTHSDAGKYALNQYFGHWVHAYARYMFYSGEELENIRKLALYPDSSLSVAKKMFCDVSKPRNIHHMLVVYGGQKSLGKYVDEMIGVLPSVRPKKDFLELLETFQGYVSRLYWWFHWYFPWGVGPAICPRLGPDDIKEIVRLSQAG